MANNKSSKIDTDNAVELRHGKLNNFTAWRLNQIECCGILYGKQANVLKDYQKYKIRAVTESDYEPSISTVV